MEMEKLMVELQEKVEKEYEDYKGDLALNINSSTTPLEVLDHYAYEYTIVTELHFYVINVADVLGEATIKGLLSIPNIIDAFLSCWYKYDFSVISEITNILDVMVERYGE